MKEIGTIDTHMHFLKVEFFFCNGKYIMYLLYINILKVKMLQI